MVEALTTLVWSSAMKRNRNSDENTRPSTSAGRHRSGRKAIPRQRIHSASAPTAITDRKPARNTGCNP